MVSLVKSWFSIIADMTPLTLWYIYGSVCTMWKRFFNSNSMWLFCCTKHNKLIIIQRVSMRRSFVCWWWGGFEAIMGNNWVIYLKEAVTLASHTLHPYVYGMLWWLLGVWCGVLWGSRPPTLGSRSPSCLARLIGTWNSNPQKSN